MLTDQEFVRESLITNLYYLRTLREYCARIEVSFPNKFQEYKTRSKELAKRCETIGSRLINLSDGDIINLYYKDKIYTYEIYNKYEIEKTGVITINVIDENNITLITCLRDTNKQLVIVARLVNIQERGTENE